MDNGNFCRRRHLVDEEHDAPIIATNGRYLGENHIKSLHSWRIKYYWHRVNEHFYEVFKSDSGVYYKDFSSSWGRRRLTIRLRDSNRGTVICDIMCEHWLTYCTNERDWQDHLIHRTETRNPTIDDLKEYQTVLDTCVLDDARVYVIRFFQQIVADGHAKMIRSNEMDDSWMIEVDGNRIDVREVEQYYYASVSNIDILFMEQTREEFSGTAESKGLQKVLDFIDTRHFYDSYGQNLKELKDSFVTLLMNWAGVYTKFVGMSSRVVRALIDARISELFPHNCVEPIDSERLCWWDTHGWGPFKRNGKIGDFAIEEIFPSGSLLYFNIKGSCLGHSTPDGRTYSSPFLYYGTLTIANDGGVVVSRRLHKVIGKIETDGFHDAEGQITSVSQDGLIVCNGEYVGYIKTFVRLRDREGFGIGADFESYKHSTGVIDKRLSGLSVFGLYPDRISLDAYERSKNIPSYSREYDFRRGSWH